MDWNITANVVAQSANRVLGLLIAKSKSVGGMPFDMYTKLFDSMMWPVIAYGAAEWGTRQFSCIDAVQLKAQRYLLGTGKYIPSAAVASDMGWIPTFIKQYKCKCINGRVMSICPMIELINAFSTSVKARVVHDVKICISGFRNMSVALTVQILLTCNED